MRSLIPACDAEAILKCLVHGHVLFMAPSYAGEYAACHAHHLLREFPEIDSVIIYEWAYGQEIPCIPGKEVRKEIKRAYKEGWI